MVAEALGMDADRFGKHPQIVVKALDHDIEMPPHSFIALVKAAIQPPLQPAETCIHRAFEL